MTLTIRIAVTLAVAVLEVVLLLLVARIGMVNQTIYPAVASDVCAMAWSRTQSEAVI
ncbi:hypothetical protein ACFELC_23525 [Pseudomonas aeruginosa]|uniref:hypothetical protein n=1 Tax=Pseudomonas aeruginosa TaxID=287 RepID=UPI00383B752C